MSLTVVWTVHRIARLVDGPSALRWDIRDPAHVLGHSARPVVSGRVASRHITEVANVLDKGRIIIYWPAPAFGAVKFLISKEWRKG
jgi:hypothetical protein